MSSSSEIRRTLGWVLVGSLCFVAAVAIFAILTDSFDDDDWRVIGTSLGFAVFSATGASGATLRLRTSESLRTLGLVTMVVSTLAFVLLLWGIWDEDGTEKTWEWFAAAALATLAASHASVVAGARRDTDSDAIRMLATTSIALTSFQAGVGILGIAGAFDEVEVDEGAARAFGVLVVLTVLSTVLPPIMRRLQPGGGEFPTRTGDTAARAEVERAGAGEGPPPPAADTRAPSAPAPLAAEVITAVDRILALNSEAGDHAPEIQRECERLRELARTYAR